MLTRLINTVYSVVLLALLRWSTVLKAGFLFMKRPHDIKQAHGRSKDKWKTDINQYRWLLKASNNFIHDFLIIKNVSALFS